MAETSVTTPERLAALTRWLGERLGAPDFALVGAPEAASNGSSNETALLAGRWSVAGEQRSGGFVVRTAPRGEGLYDRYDLALQYRTMEALADTDVPVPRLVGLEQDPAVLGEAFYVMARSPGIAPPDLPPYTAGGWLLDAPPHEQGRLLDATIGVIGRIHRVDVAAHGLGFLNQTGARTGFDDQFDRTVAWYRWAAGGREQPIMDATLAWLEANRPVDPPPEGLNWGDVRLGNVLYEGVEPVCVLDWEMAGLGPGRGRPRLVVLHEPLLHRGDGHRPAPRLPR